jgi:hypothetical protein
MALKAAIGAALTTPTMTSKDVLKSAHNYVCFRKCSTEEQKTFVGAVEFIFQIANLLCLSKRYENTVLQWVTTQELVAQYPSFENLSTVELALLLKFRNAIEVVLTVFPAYRNKATILRFAGKLEGVNKAYITGTGQSAEVDRRVAIYEKEGGVVAERRLEARKRKVKTSNEASANPRKRGREANLDSALVDLILPSATPDDFPIHAALGQQPGGTPAAAAAVPQYFYAPVPRTAGLTVVTLLPSTRPPRRFHSGTGIGCLSPPRPPVSHTTKTRAHRPISRTTAFSLTQLYSTIHSEKVWQEGCNR